MTSGYMIKIFFRDGRTEEHYCDCYEKKNGLRYKEFNFVKSMIDFIKFLPLIEEEEN